MSIWGTLTCGHSLLLCDPDMDVRGSEFCAVCGCWTSFVAFSECGGDG